jgi:hypothetical protein
MIMYVVLKNSYKFRLARHKLKLNRNDWNEVHSQALKFHARHKLLEIGVNVVDWIGLAQDRYRWRALVNSVMKLRVP